MRAALDHKINIIIGQKSGLEGTGHSSWESRQETRDLAAFSGESRRDDRVWCFQLLLITTLTCLSCFRYKPGGPNRIRPWRRRLGVVVVVLSRGSKTEIKHTPRCHDLPGRYLLIISCRLLTSKTVRCRCAAYLKIKTITEIKTKLRRDEWEMKSKRPWSHGLHTYAGDCV